jgi:hypothetical protein
VIALAMACQLAVAPMMSAALPAETESAGNVTLSGPPQSLLSDRKTLPAAMSLVVPGSGQLMQGQVEKGTLHLAAAGTLLLLMLNAEGQKANVSGPSSTAANVRTMSAVGLLGLALWSPLDAWLFGANDPKSH